VSFAQEPVHFLLDYLDGRAASISSESPESRMLGLANILIDLASASERRVAEMLAEQAADVASRARFSVSEQLDDPALPATWKHLLWPWLKSPTLSTDPMDLGARVASPNSVRQLARGYGKALAAWPALWRWAAQRGAPNRS
jgi:hypothetical protein